VEESLRINFKGPFSWAEGENVPSILDVAVGQRPGIYLWTVSLHDGHLVYYVGQTGHSFRDRLLEHYQLHAACMYPLYEPAAFARGKKICLWPGLWHKSNRRSAVECIRYFHKAHAIVSQLTEICRFLVAPLDFNGRLRERIEGAISSALAHAPKPAGAFQDTGLRYRPRRKGDQPLTCMVSSAVTLIGLPRQLEV